MRKFYSPKFKKFSFFAFVLGMLFSLMPFTNAIGQITQVGTATSATKPNYYSTITITKPTGLAVGDVMIANIVQTNYDYSNLNNPTNNGWSVVDGRIISESNYSNYYHAWRYKWYGTLLYKVATASDVAASSFVFTLDNDADDGNGAIVAFHGVDVTGGFDASGNANSGPFDVAPGNFNIITDNSAKASSITTATANAAIIMFGIESDNKNYSNWNTATGPLALNKPLYNIPYNASLDNGIGAAWALKATAGSTGTGTADLSRSNENGAILIALRLNQQIQFLQEQ